jgi:putative transposase|tara:strand:- start:162 stop:1106 length:945 start_codon:yes stop_codon:yes gene_type:complete
LQRWQGRGGGDDRRHGPKTSPPNKLTPAERQRILDVATSPEFRDLSPKQIVPKLADRQEYLGSESTFYRVLREEGMSQHRGRAKPPSAKPPAERVATGPGQVWSWDITYLRSPVLGMFFYLYVFLDVWSRKIVGFEVHEQESTDLASDLLQRALSKEGLDGVDLALHADNGSPMKGATIKATMERLGIIASFSRPRVSDDNPYSEALFRTLKYSLQYPTSFESCDQARQWSGGFVEWYNHEHLHSSIGFVTPQDRHDGRDRTILAKRRALYEAARRRNPERWAGRSTRAWSAPQAVLLNPTKDTRLALQSQKAA